MSYRPLRNLVGSAEELLALRETSPGKYLAVVYREFEKDGFIITAFLTSKIQFLIRKPGRQEKFPAAGLKPKFFIHGFLGS
ncbi:MAG: hypothetical protein KGZ49_06905 [Syntrophaceae bacterium]|nr:hypothetical protein [Syntrophaceae bacterium]